jgi:fumarate reductase iron-sulfur subunit
MLAHDAEYLGPAALNRAFTLVRDSRDGARSERLAAVGGEHGCWRCHSLFNCTEVCPKHLSPTLAIKGLKRAIILDWLRSRLSS